MTSASTFVTTTSLNVILGVILVALIVVWVRQLEPSIGGGWGDLVEPFSTEKDGPVVAALRYTYFLASQIAVWLVQLPYNFIGKLIALPGKIIRPLLSAFQPLVDMVEDMVGTVKSMVVGGGDFFKNLTQRIIDFVKSFPQHLKRLILFFVDSIKSIIGMVGTLMSVLYDIASFLMAIPSALISLVSKLSGLLSTLPRLLMKIPDAGISLMTKGTDQLNSMLS